MENIEKLSETIVEESILNDKILHLLSIFHSHPAGTSPSGTDLNHMKYLDDFSSINHKSVSKIFKNRIWLIMDARNYEVDGYIFLDGELQKIDLKIR